MKKHQKTMRRKTMMKMIFICGTLLIGSVIVEKPFQNDTMQDTPSIIETVDSLKVTVLSTEENNIDSIDKMTTDTSEWYLLLVNSWNRIPDDFSVELKQLKNGHAIDERAYPDLQDMMDAMRAEGLSPLICSSYRTNEKQKTLFDNKVSQYVSKGYSKTAAEAEAGKLVAVPGTSEHQTGLAVDIVDTSYQILDEQQENTQVQKWLIENSYKYGFILRYPSDKSDITGISYEPWHYRYVGKIAAKEMYEKGVCLEEYIDMLK